MSNQDVIEFYHGGKLITRVRSSMVPVVGSKINIMGETFSVVNITYACDFAENTITRYMRANIYLFRVAS